MRFYRSRAGTTAIEYALVASLISVFILGAVSNLGSVVFTQLYEKIAGAM